MGRLCIPMWTLELSLCDRAPLHFLFFLKPEDTMLPLQSSQGTATSYLQAHQPFFTHMGTPALFSLHFQSFMSRHLKKQRVSTSSGCIFSTYQGPGDSETAFLPPPSATFRWIRQPSPSYPEPKRDVTRTSQLGRWQYIKPRSGMFLGTGRR